MRSSLNIDKSAKNTNNFNRVPCSGVVSAYLTPIIFSFGVGGVGVAAGVCRHRVARQMSCRQ
jgi:hypothetical protein